MKSATRLHWLLVLSLFPTFLFSQTPAIQFKLQLLEADKWGVYAKPSVPIGNSTITGSGQVTLVMPLHYQWGSLASVNGIWINNTNAHGPAENPSKTYATFRWQHFADAPPFQMNAETLLFTFKRIGACPDSIHLIDAEFDPFSQLPNSVNSSPGNELNVFNSTTGSYYSYESNYAPSAWSCHDNDSDGIPNALEDTNGNGVFDAGVDASDLNIGCSSVVVTSHPADVTVCSGVSTCFTVVASTTNGSGTLQYKWQRKSTTGWLDLSNTPSSIFSGVNTNQLCISDVSGLNQNQFRCGLKTDDCNLDWTYTYPAYLTVEGPVIITSQPQNTTVCPGEGAMFQASVINIGQGPVIYEWFMSTDGVTYFQILNTGNYTGFNTSTLMILNTTWLMNGLRFRLRYKTANCNLYWTNHAVLTVIEQPFIASQPTNQLANPNETAIFSVEATSYPNEDLTYKWQFLNSNGSWFNLYENGLFEGVNTDSLKILNTTGLNGQVFRVLVSSGSCTPKASDVAQLTVLDTIETHTTPNGIVTCPGEAIKITPSIIGDTTYFRKWQRMSVNGGFYNIGPFQPTGFGGFYINPNSDTLIITNTTGLDGYQYRLFLHNPLGEAAQTPSTLSLNCDSVPPTTGCIKLKLQLLPDSTGWGVFAKPFDGYSPSANAVATEGRVTVVAPANMPLEGLESVTGQWSLTSTTLGLPSHPSSKFLTFEMLSNATPIGLSSAVETMLFKFDKVGECPNFLRLMEGNIPNSLSPNTLNGTDTNNLTSNGFEYCGVYNRKAWRCKNGGIWSNIGSIIVVTTDTLDAPQPGATDRDSDFSKENLTEGQDWFTASPNPAGDFVNIVFREKPEIEATPTITLWDLQGRKLQEKVVENAATQLDLSGLPAGVYLVSLAQNGRVLQREKLVLK